MAPLVAPAAAAQGKGAGMTEMSMSADMPCCPDQKTMDCQDCPLMAMCVLQSAQAGAPTIAALPLRYAVRTAHLFVTTRLPPGSTGHLPTILLEP